MPGELSGKAAIVGIGATDFSKNSGRSELRLASEAVLDALDDAGLTPADVDGMVTFTMDSNTEVAIARATGIGELKFFSKIHHGGGAACATVQQAAIAVATGVAECVVAYRAFNERSGTRFGQVQMRLVENADSTGVDNSFSYPHGLSTPAAQVAMIARRYVHLSGATSKDFGAVSVADRKHAAKNPKAYFYGKPITIEDHQNSRWIAEPLRLLDCCQETDGAVARPANVEAASQGRTPATFRIGDRVPDVEHVLVTADTGVPISGLILGLTHASTWSSEGTYARVSFRRDAVVDSARNHLQTLAPRWLRLRSVCVGRVIRRCQAPGERGFANPSR